MPPPSSEGGFQLPSFYYDLSPKAKITFFRSLVSDPDNKSSYPVYDAENSDGDPYYQYYRSKDNSVSYRVWRNVDNEIVVERSSKASIFNNSSGNLFKAGSPGGKINIKENLDDIEGKAEFKIGPEVKGAIWKSDYQRTIISNEDGHAYVYEREKYFSDLKGSAKLNLFSVFNEKNDIKKFEIGLDVAKAKKSWTFVESPKISVNPVHPDQTLTNQTEAGVSIEASLGFKIDYDTIKDLKNALSSVKDLKSLANITKLKPFSIGPGLEIKKHEDTLVNIPLSEKEILLLQNEAINARFKQNEIDELNNDLREYNFDNLGKPSMLYTPTLSAKEKKELEQRLQENEQRLKEIGQIESQQQDPNNNSYSSDPNSSQPLGSNSTYSTGDTKEENKDSRHTTERNYNQSGSKLNLEPLLRSIAQGIQQLQHNLNKA